MDPFGTLGLPRRYDIDMHELESRYRNLQKALHPDKHVGASASQRRLSLENAVQVNEAYRVLKDELRRAEALLSLHGGSGAAGEPEDPAFLLEMLEQREALGEAKDARDLARARTLAASIEQQRQQVRAELVQAFASLEQSPGEHERTRTAALIGRLKYFRRFLDEVGAIEEEVAG